jgi:hypothetical protein
MAHARADADACELCGSTRFHIDNGLRYCSNGHEQAVRLHHDHLFMAGDLRTLTRTFRVGNKLLTTPTSMALRANGRRGRRRKAR